VCVCYKQGAVIEFLLTDKESVSSISGRLCNVCESCAVERNTFGRWAIRVTDGGTGKAELSFA